MKTLKFLILALGLIAAQGAVAVTLPSTSYNPYSGGGSSYEAEPSGQLITLPSSSFRSLGAGEPVWCSDQTPGTTACSDCCYEAVIACYSGGGEESECDANNLECTRYCDGHSLPLDAPLWALILLFVILCASFQGCAALMRSSRQL